MRRQKIHLRDKSEPTEPSPWALCKRVWGEYTEDPELVTCKNCQRIMESKNYAERDDNMPVGKLTVIEDFLPRDL